MSRYGDRDRDASSREGRNSNGLTEKQLQDQHQKILNDLLQEPANKECADCGARGPRWASSKLGVFICIKCSGIHRHLGTHISFVRSVSLDKWTPEQIKKMQEVGNARAKEIYEYNVPENYRRPNENDTYELEQWIRAKYERKEFMKREAREKDAGSRRDNRDRDSRENRDRDSRENRDREPRDRRERDSERRRDQDREDRGGRRRDHDERGSRRDEPARAKPQENKPAPNLLDLFDEPSPSPVHTQHAHTQIAHPNHAAHTQIAAVSNDDFGQFVGPTDLFKTPALQHSHQKQGSFSNADDLFGDFVSSPPPQNNSGGNAHASKSDIMNLYNGVPNNHMSGGMSSNGSSNTKANYNVVLDPVYNHGNTGNMGMHSGNMGMGANRPVNGNMGLAMHGGASYGGMTNAYSASMHHGNNVHHGNNAHHHGNNMHHVNNMHHGNSGMYGNVSHQGGSHMGMGMPVNGGMGYNAANYNSGYNSGGGYNGIQSGGYNGYNANNAATSQSCNSNHSMNGLF
eukprot:TRINITY_DN2178_c1_g1_i1.p1 TRINITY_DN2178_c1_g1~~TRINITY_DN2178_c1_g1_i1.p1  ORF type:complete len:515 (+),score=112.31 TRINITY_DN2178_c1_g1_i1:158-1702(+)